MASNTNITCPVCGSKNIYVGKHGFSTGKAAIAGLLTGNVFVATAAGGVGADRIELTCLDCGKKFKIGEGGHENLKKLHSVAEIKEFEKHVIPKEEMPKSLSFKCDCGRIFVGEKFSSCPACGRKMFDRNIMKVEDYKKQGGLGCLGIILFPFVSLIVYWVI